MRGKTYFLFVLIGNITGLVFAVVSGLFEEEIFSNPVLTVVALIVFLYACISLLTVWIDLYVSEGISVVSVGVIISGPIGAILYLVYLYMGSIDFGQDKSHT